jgi:poly-gamma-glutamate capsule biosynthesis protein CapA/YwtB (metallophosphatase superfamily)
LLFGPLPSPQKDSGFGSVVKTVRDASLGVTNLEENLLDSSDVPGDVAEAGPRWSYGTQREAKALRTIGFTVVSLANNHAADYGPDGLEKTAQILGHVGLLHVGTGDDLQHARMPVYVGTAARRVAVIAVAISASPETRATYTRGEILGRPGVSTLKFKPDVTVDSASFTSLKKSSALSPETVDSNEITLYGTRIKKGKRTIVKFVPDETDLSDILGQIRTARMNAEVVMVLVHSHEPANRSQTPAQLFQDFARAAINAGAGLVVGTGPHQLRGVEVYRGGVIFYSLGNFIFDYSAVDPVATDVYDAGADLYRLALGTVQESNASSIPGFEESEWWESAIAIVTFDHGVLQSVQLQPIDLGVDLPVASRGTPRLASPARGNEILLRLARLSNGLGAQLHIENGVGVVDLGGPGH